MSYIGQRPVVGRYIKLDQISSGFNGSETSFSMTAGSQAVFPGTARNLLLSLGGVIQEPDTNFTISGSTLTFTTAPVANTTFFAVIFGDMQSTGTPSDGTVLPASIASSGNFSFPQLTVTGTSSLGDDVTFTGANYNVVWDKSANALEFADNALIILGTGNDLQIIHDGSNSRLKNNTGTLFLQSNGIKLKNFGSTEHYINCIDNGAVELYYDSSKKFETTNIGVTVTGGVTADGVTLGDNQNIQFGASNDLKIFHNGSHSYIADLGTGDLRITGSAIHLQDAAQSENMLKTFENDRVELYYDNGKKFETTSTGVKAYGDFLPNTGDTHDLGANGAKWSELHLKHYLYMPDAGRIRLGSSYNMQLFYDSSTQVLLGKTGNTVITCPSGQSVRLNKSSADNFNAESMLRAFADGAVELYHNNSKKFETHANGVHMSGSIYVPDNEIAGFGDTSNPDLRIYHDGSNSLIHNDTGSVIIENDASNSNSIFIKAKSGEHSIIANHNGGVELYHDNSKKFETTSTGFKTESSSDVVFRLTKTASSDAEIKNTDSLDLCCSSGGSGGQIIRFLTGANPSSLVEHMRVTGGGHVLFNQSTTHVPGLANTTVGASMEDVGSQGSALFVSRADSISLFLNRNNTGQMVSFRQSGTEVGSISTNSHSLPSDRNFKKNITDLTLGLDFVNTLKPSKYNLKLEEDTDPLQFGLIAQDVEEALTAAGVSKNSIALCQHNPKEDEAESDYNLDYGKFVPILINAIKELSTKVAALEAA